jgi:hypothetical protein
MKTFMCLVLTLVVPLIQFSTATEQVFSVIAGDGTVDYQGDNGPATMAQLDTPFGVWATSNGDAYITSWGQSSVRKVEAATGIITTIMGTGADDYSAVGGVGASFPLYGPWGVQANNAGTILYVSDAYHIWKYDMSTTLSTRYAGSSDGGCLSVPGGDPGCTEVATGDNGAATSAYFGNLAGMYLRGDGVIFVTDNVAQNVRRIASAAPNIITLFAGNGNTGFSGEGVQATSASFDSPSSVFAETTGVVYIGDDYNERVRKVALNGIITTFAGGGTGTTDGVLATTYNIGRIGGITSIEGTVIITSYSTHKVYQVTSSGIISTVAGSGTQGTSLGYSPFTADLNEPSAISFTVDGSFTPIVLLSETGPGLVKRVLFLDSPTTEPSSIPSAKPAHPSSEPSGKPSSNPVAEPTGVPSGSPSTRPSGRPSAVPSDVPSSVPSGKPSGSPSGIPSSKPAAEPTGEPTGIPSSLPVVSPTGLPSSIPSERPSAVPSAVPTSPSSVPSSHPSILMDTPSSFPSGFPSSVPSSVPSSKPFGSPTTVPSSLPSSFPSSEPTTIPSAKPSVRPSDKPSSLPSSEPTSPSFAPTKAPNVNDLVEIKGEFVVSTVYDNFLNNRSLTTLTAAVYNISGSAQHVEITATRLLSKKGRMQDLAVVTYRFKIDFLAVYYLAYYSGWNSSYVAEVKSNSIKAAVEGGTFQSVLQDLAEARNATQLLEASCDTVILSSTVISPDTTTSSSSNHKSHMLSDGAIAGIVVGSFMAFVFFVLYLIARYLDDKNAAPPSKAVDIIV